MQLSQYPSVHASGPVLLWALHSPPAHRARPPALHLHPAGVQSSARRSHVLDVMDGQQGGTWPRVLIRVCGYLSRRTLLGIPLVQPEGYTLRINLRLLPGHTAHHTIEAGRLQARPNGEVLNVNGPVLFQSKCLIFFFASQKSRSLFRLLHTPCLDRCLFRLQIQVPELFCIALNLELSLQCEGSVMRLTARARTACTERPTCTRWASAAAATDCCALFATRSSISRRCKVSRATC